MLFNKNHNTILILYLQKYYHPQKVHSSEKMTVLCQFISTYYSMPYRSSTQNRDSKIRDFALGKVLKSLRKMAYTVHNIELITFQFVL